MLERSLNFFAIAIFVSIIFCKTASLKFIIICSVDFSSNKPRDIECDFVMLVRQEADELFNFAGNFHSVVTCDARPSGETALYAIEVPPCGGDTHFANTALAFETLTYQLQQNPVSYTHLPLPTNREV